MRVRTRAIERAVSAPAFPSGSTPGGTSGTAPAPARRTAPERAPEPVPAPVPEVHPVAKAPEEFPELIPMNGVREGRPVFWVHHGNGGVHVYDITTETNPTKVGYWNIDTVGTTTDAVDGRCTAHVFDIHEEQGLMTIAYYNGGVRVVDLSGLVGISLGGTQLTGAGMRELAFYRIEGANSWSAKTPGIDPRTGDFLGNFPQALVHLALISAAVELTRPEA